MMIVLHFIQLKANSVVKNTNELALIEWEYGLTIV